VPDSVGEVVEVCSAVGEATGVAGATLGEESAGTVLFVTSTVGLEVASSARVDSPVESPVGNVVKIAVGVSVVVPVIGVGRAPVSSTFKSDGTIVEGLEPRITVGVCNNVIVGLALSTAVGKSDEMIEGVSLITIVGSVDQVTVGIALSISVGSVDNVIVGFSLFTTVGSSDKVAVGLSVFTTVGSALSTTVGSTDGVTVGLRVVEAVGDADGFEVGIELGAGLGASLGTRLGFDVTSIGDSAGFVTLFSSLTVGVRISLSIVDSLVGGIDGASLPALGLLVFASSTVTGVFVGKAKIELVVAGGAEGGF
jgi:hypothetical protein